MLFALRFPLRLTTKDTSKNSKKTFAFYSEGLFHFHRLPVQKKCFCRLGTGFCIAPSETKIQVHTKDKKTAAATLPVAANGCFHDSGKRGLPLGVIPVPKQKAKGPFP